MRTLRSQLRKAPSYSNLGGLRDAVSQQLSIATSALWVSLRTQQAMKRSKGRQRENRAANTAGCSWGCRAIQMSVRFVPMLMTLEPKLLLKGFSRLDASRANLVMVHSPQYLLLSSGGTFIEHERTIMAVVCHMNFNCVVTFVKAPGT